MSTAGCETQVVAAALLLLSVVVPTTNPRQGQDS